MSESNDERSPGFTKSLTSRLVAAGLFVILGTVAVAYYVNYCRDGSDSTATAKSDANDVESESSDDPSSNPADDQKPSSTLALKPIADQPTTKLVQDKSDSPNKKPVAFDSAFKPQKTAGNSPAPNTRRTTNNNRANGLPPSKSFALPKVVKPQSDFATQPTNNPTAASTNLSNSFGATNAPTTNPVQKPQGSVANRFQQLKQNTNQFMSAAGQKGKQAAGEIVNKTNNALRNIADSAETAVTGLNNRTNQKSAFDSSKPANTQQSSLPPANPRSSFDTSKDLQPFPSGKNAVPAARNNSMPPIVSRSSNPPIQNNRGQNPVGQLPSTRPQTGPPVQPVSTGTGRPILSGSPAASLATSNLPGDRKLEGLQAPSVTVEKIAPREIQVNTPADFELVVKNVGRIAANDVMVYDQIPTGAELVQSMPQPQRGSGGRITWDLDTLKPGQEKRIKLQLKPLAPGEIGSVAQVSFSAMASMRTKVTKPVLSVRHATQPRVLIGDSVTLNIDVTNEGDGPAKEVVIQEDLPEGLSFSEGYRELEYAVGTLGPGQSKRISLELKAAKIGKYRNVLVAHAQGGLQAQHAVDLEVIAPRLQATGEGPTRRFLNRQATHRFAVRNTGTAPATNVELVCRLPAGLRFVDSNNRGKFDENSNAVYWSLAELDAGLVANVELTTVPREPGNQDLKFEVASDLGQSANAVCKLNVEHLIDVFFDIDDIVDPIEIGSDTAYKLRVVNQGTKTATNVQLQVEFPRGIQPTAVEGNINSEIRGQQIAFQPITSLNPGDEIEITIRGKGITAGDHRVAVNLMADGREVNVSKQESTRVYSDR